MNDWIGALEVYGYNAPLIPYSEWSTKVKDYVNDAAEKEEHALLPLFHFVVGDLPGNSIAPELDDANALGALGLYDAKQGAQADAQASSNVNIDVLGTYLAYLVTIGFLPAPSGENGGQPLPKLDDSLLQALASSQFGGRSARS
jgi:L-aminoadipate-semialdehyde dehydrogenase